jgi:hypothetical protein
MKSLLQEGSSIIRAVEAAWIKAGMPVEFSIKVLKNEEQRFLGIAWKNSVVVSISYDFAHHDKRPSHQKSDNKQDQKKSFNHQDILEKVMRDTERLQAETNCFAEDKKVLEKRVIEKPKKQQEKKVDATEKALSSEVVKNSKKNEQKKVEKPVKSEESSLEVSDNGEVEHKERWTEPMIQAVEAFLKSIFTIMELQAPFIHKVDGFQLRILFEQPLYENNDQAYRVYTSLAFLMLQMIKKEFKKKFKGYRVVFGVQNQESNNP